VRPRRSYYLFLTFQVAEVEEVAVERNEFGTGKLGIDFAMLLVYTNSTLERRSSYDQQHCLGSTMGRLGSGSH
jgi:hypothetical protein